MNAESSLKPRRGALIFATGPKTIRVCSGIGDNIWLLQKLVNSGERFNFKLAGEAPRRGKALFELLPSVSFSAEYAPHTSIACAALLNAQKNCETWAEITRRYPPDFHLSANGHLEFGRRIEEFLPDLKTSFAIDWMTSPAAKAEAALLTPVGTKWIGLFGSSYASQRVWSFWGAEEWSRLASALSLRFGNVIGFVVIGAAFDSDLAGRLVENLSRHGRRLSIVIARPLEVVVEVLKRLSYFFSFPSGLGILAPTVHCPTLMFYPPILEKMMNAWADPIAIETGAYKGMLFCELPKVLEWVMEGYKLNQKL